MKEYQSCKTNSEVLFNNMLREACNPIECAFGRLKARWSILTRKMNLKLENIPIVVMACFVLHNFCEWHNDTVKLDAQLQMRKLPNSSKNTQTNFVFQIAILSTQLTPEQAFYIAPPQTPDIYIFIIIYIFTQNYSPFP